MYKLTTLPNGLKIVSVDMPHMESVSLGIWIRVGGRYENTKNCGISHFLEHMVFKATKTRTGKVIKESIEGIGGTLNGFTGEETTCYFVKVTSAYLSLGLDILSDMVLNPKLNKKDMEKERGVILEEIKMYMDLPNHYVHELLSKLMWPRHPLGMPLAGTLDSIKKMNQKDLFDFKEKFYSPENIVIACSGKISGNNFLEKITSHFKRLKKIPLPYSKRVTSRQARLRTNFLYKDTEQTHLAMGFHGYSLFHPDRYAVDLLHVILGGNMSSRLFHEVREKRGLAYDISSSTKHYSDTGGFIISTGLNNKELVNAIDVILKELRKIKKSPVKADEFRRSKDFCKGQLLMALENTSSRMSWIGEKIITGDPFCEIDEVLEMLDKVTIDDLNRLAKNIFKSSNLSVAIIGPVGETHKKDLNKIFYEGIN